MDKITLDYGSGGKKTSSLIENLILPILGNDALNKLNDGAIIKGADKLAFSTDSFVVNPIFFNGGDIGKLSVCGTVNDISMCGAIPKYMSLSFIIEEGFLYSDLEVIVKSIGDMAKKCNVSIVTGDTKVVNKGLCDGIYINTSAVGYLVHNNLDSKNIRPKDKVILSGYCGNHGTSIMLSRNKDLLNGNIKSDCGPLDKLSQALYYLKDDLRVLRDPTRGGVATTLNEFVENTSYSIELGEKDIPIEADVLAACEILGIDPLYCANEGKLLAVVSPDKADEALSVIRSFDIGKNAAIIGEVVDNHPKKVILKTSFGGSRILSKLSGDQLPRIC